MVVLNVFLCIERTFEMYREPDAVIEKKKKERKKKEVLALKLDPAILYRVLKKACI